MNESDKFRLADMVSFAKEATDLLGNLSVEKYEIDNRTYRACERCLEIVGEAADKISKDFQNLHSEIDWKGAIGMRHVLIHGYGKIRHKIVYDTIKTKLPTLITELEKILTQNGDEK